jgi:hypothetical protein
MPSTDLISVAAIIVGFGVTAIMFRVERELHVLEDLKIKLLWLAWGRLSDTGLRCVGSPRGYCSATRGTGHATDSYSIHSGTLRRGRRPSGGIYTINSGPLSNSV